MIFLVILIVFLINLISLKQNSITEQSAIEFIEEDLAEKYPNYEREIIFVENKTNFDTGERYFFVKASVVKDKNKPCPERINIYYNYPEQNFVTKPEEKITENCHVCKNCILLFDEEAIISSHVKPGTEKVQKYLLEYPDAKAKVNRTKSGFEVIWDSNLSSYSYKVILDKKGNVINIEKIEKAIN